MRAASTETSAAHPGYAVRQRIRMSIEKSFSWIAGTGMWEGVDGVNRYYIVFSPEIIEHQTRNLPLRQPLGKSHPTTGERGKSSAC
jgi:hypothetical protein